MEINQNGIHRVSLWRIAGFSLNNTATNMYMFLMNFIAYYINGYLGVAVMLASTIVTVMRIWDGFTDPFIGYLVDKTEGKFGKNRPFMLIGNVIMIITSYIMLHFSHRMPEGGRFLFFLVFYALYIIGYTFQCIVTKSGQACLTNEPKQRPLFSAFNGIFVTATFTLMPILFTGVLAPKYGGFKAEFFQEAWRWVAPISLLLTIIAMISIAPKDRKEYFGSGKKVMIRFRDYWDVMKNNRAIQMLVVAAGTDKLATQTQGNATVGVLIYAIVCGNYKLNGAVSAYTSIPSLLFLFFGVGYIARRMGQRKAMIFGSLGAFITCIMSVALFYIGDPSTLSFPGVEGFQGWNFFTISFLVLWIGMKGFTNISSNIVFPMTADCADYEVYRSGRYIPGMLGALFSFVDKLISSFATTVVGLLCAAIGFTAMLPAVDTPYSESLKAVGLFCMYGMVAIGLLCNLLAMKFYPLTKEKMEEIQDEISAIKRQTMQEDTVS